MKHLKYKINSGGRPLSSRTRIRFWNRITDKTFEVEEPFIQIYIKHLPVACFLEHEDIYVIIDTQTFALLCKINKQIMRVQIRFGKSYENSLFYSLFEGKTY